MEMMRQADIDCVYTFVRERLIHIFKYARCAVLRRRPFRKRFVEVAGIEHDPVAMSAVLTRVNMSDHSAADKADAVLVFFHCFLLRTRNRFF